MAPGQVNNDISLHLFRFQGSDGYSMFVPSLHRYLAKQICSRAKPYIMLIIKELDLFVCLCLPRDLANYLTDMVLLYSIASHRSLEHL